MTKFYYHFIVSLTVILLPMHASFAGQVEQQDSSPVSDETDQEVTQNEAIETADDAVDAIDAADEVIDSDLIPLPVSSEMQLTLDYYHELIEQLEISGGVYDNQLSEVLSGLGNIYQSLNRHSDAIEIFKRALHITRVNEGLHGIGQLALLEKLIESNSKLKDWAELKNNYHNLYWISKRHYGDNSPKLLPIIDRIGRWYLKAFELDPDSASLSHLLNAEDLYNKSVEIVETEGDNNDMRLINSLYGIALTNYQIAAQVSSSEDLRDIRSGFRDSNRARRALQLEQMRADFMLRSYIKGRDAMQKIIDIHANNPNLPVDMQAMAMTHLGDWFLLFNKRNSAAEAYKKAYALLEQDGFEQQKIDSLFGKPRTLPAIRLPVHKEEDLAPENPPYVLASFDVSPTGKASNIQIVESKPEDNVSYQRRAKKSIAATKFRPRYENGEPVTTTGVSLRYVFTD